MKLGIKGVSAVIATLLMLLITVAIASTAYMYITTMSGGAKQCLTIADSYCNSAGAVIKLRNVCTDTIAASTIIVTKIAPWSNASANNITTAIATKSIGIYTDTNCSSVGMQCTYRFLGPSADAIEDSVYCS